MIVMVLLLVGLTGIIVGTLIRGLADRETIADLVADETIHSDIFGEEDLIEFIHITLDFGGLGLIGSGTVIVVWSIIFGTLRMTYWRNLGKRSSRWSNAILGTLVTLLTSFVILSPILGGVVAGYLERDGIRHAILAGSIMGILVILTGSPLLIALAWGFFQGGFTGSTLILLLFGAFATVFVIGLGALGGYAGAALSNPRDAAVPHE